LLELGYIPTSSKFAKGGNEVFTANRRNAEDAVEDAGADHPVPKNKFE